MTFHYCDTCDDFFYSGDMIKVEAGRYRCLRCAKKNPTLIVDIGDFHMECCPEAMTVKERRHMMAVLGRHARQLQKQVNATK